MANPSLMFATPTRKLALGAALLGLVAGLIALNPPQNETQHEYFTDDSPPPVPKTEEALSAVPDSAPTMEAPVPAIAVVSRSEAERSVSEIESEISDALLAIRNVADPGERRRTYAEFLALNEAVFTELDALYAMPLTDSPNEQELNSTTYRTHETY